MDGIAGEFSGGTLRIYTGSQPANAGDAPTGDLVVEISLPTPAFSAATGGSASMSGSWSGTAATSADLTTQGWYRIQSGDGSVRKDGEVGEQLTLDDYNIIEGGTVTITAAQLSMPASA